MSNHYSLNDAVKTLIVGRLETRQSQVKNSRDFNVMPIVATNLWKQFSGTKCIEIKLQQNLRNLG